MLLAVSVSTLVPVVGLGENDAVTPLGRLGAARVTPPVNPFWSITVTVDVAEEPWFRIKEDGESLNVKFAGFTVSRTVVVSVSEPEVPVIVIATEVASEEVLLAVRVNTLVPVVGLGLKDAVTP